MPAIAPENSRVLHLDEEVQRHFGLAFGIVAKPHQHPLGAVAPCVHAAYLVDLP